VPGELRFTNFLTGRPVYALVWQDAAELAYWTGTAFAADSAPNRVPGAVPLAESPAGSGDYAGDLPAGLPAGPVVATYWQRAGATPGLGDYGPLGRETLAVGEAGTTDATWTYAVTPAGPLLRQVGRLVRGQVFRAALARAGTAAAGPALRFHLAGGPAVDVPVGPDGGGLLAVPAAATAALPPGTRPWELWAEGVPAPVAAGWLVVAPAVRPLP
jgi:hypothetical protein